MIAPSLKLCKIKNRVEWDKVIETWIADIGSGVDLISTTDAQIYSHIWKPIPPMQFHTAGGGASATSALPIKTMLLVNMVLVIQSL